MIHRAVSSSQKVMAAKLGIVAGSGELPLLLIEACRAGARPYFVLGIEGSCDPESLAGQPHAFVRLGASGAGIALLRKERVEELVMAGGVRRPTPWELRPDWRTARFYAKIGMRALTDFGDDALLRAIVKEIESEGFRVVGVDSLQHDLLTPLGALGRIVPDAAALADIEAGIAAARSHGAEDRGQAVIVRHGVVVEREDQAGTDAMIQRARASGVAQGAVMVKTAKPGQERRVDLPAIGVTTIASARTAGLRGIAVEAGGSLVLGHDAVGEAADRAGIFVVGIAAS
jgi:hypothetical protein